jgi:hypothetical protein
MQKHKLPWIARIARSEENRRSHTACVEGMAAPVPGVRWFYSCPNPCHSWLLFSSFIDSTEFLISMNDAVVARALR